MHLFPNGIIVSKIEYVCLLHVEADPEGRLLTIIKEKGKLRREALINEWKKRLFADPSVTELPADADALAQLIMARSDYQSYAEANPSLKAIAAGRHNIDRFAARPSIEVANRVTLFSLGIDVLDFDCDCILAYVQDLEDWVIGALMSQANRGKKKMLDQYHPIILADPSVTTMPATEDGLINMIVARSDYQRLGG